MKLYLAGPDVFRPDAAQWAEHARRLCRQDGHEALIPLDGVETTAAGIYHANIGLIQSADAVLANLNPFPRLRAGFRHLRRGWLCTGARQAGDRLS